MEKSKLSVIRGLKIVDVELVEDGAGISLENGINLIIYNKYRLIGLNFEDAHLLIGHMVTHIEEDIDTITIKFENDRALRIDMKDDAYTGPEAMQLRVPGEPIVIWN